MANSHSSPTGKATEPTTGDSGQEVLLHELAALRRSAAVLRDFIETSTIGLHWLGADGTILWVNQAELDLLGYSREEYVGRNIAEFHADESVIDDILARLSRDETLRDYSARLRHRDGSIRHVLINSSVLFEDGEFVHTRCFTRDVTSLRQEQEVHHLLAAIVDSSDDAIFGKSLDGTIESWNAGAEKLFGYPAEEVIGKPMSVLLPPDRLFDFPDILTRIRTGGHLKHHEVTLMRKDGRRVDVSMTTSPVRDSGGRLAGSSTIARDVTERREADTALRRSEERFRFAQLAARIGTFDWDIKTGINTWTPELEAMYGLAPGGFPRTQTAWEALLHPDDRERVLQSVAESFKTGTAIEADWRVVWPDRSIHWISGRWQVFKDATGEPVRMMGVNIDITDRKNTEEELRKGEERLRLAIKATNDAVWDLDLKAGTVSWNETYSTLYGRPDAADSWRFWIDRIHPEDRARTVDSFQAALNGGESSWSSEYRFRRADGRWAYIYDRAYIARDASDNAWRVIGAMQDLTVQKQAEAAMRESEERLRASEARLMSAQRLANLGSWERNDATGNTEFSDEMLRILGMPDNPPRTLAEFLNYVHSEDRKYVSDGVLRARSTDELVSGEYRIIRADGEIRFIRSVLQAIRDERGIVIRVVGATQDITDLKRTQQESAARQQLESLGTLASGIAHDFNNLLGGVLAESELAMAELEAGLRPKRELEAIRTVALRGSEIVRQLMVYAGVESATVGPVDLSQIIREMIELLKVSASKHALLETDLAKDLPSVQADAAQIRRIVMNLVTNASEAIGNRDGVIRIAARRMSPDEGSSGEISGHLSGLDFVLLEISDTGCGMLPGVQNRVFDPFFTTKSAGHGLGLAIVDGTVRSLQGKLHLASEPGKGTTFQILLPCSEITSIPEPLSPVQGVAHFSTSATVLVVEDEDVLRQAAAKALRRSGFEVLEAANGSAAIDVLRANGRKIDVMLLDITIPGSSSDEVVSEYAKVRSEAKVILTSAYSEETARKAMSVPHVRGFIRKPFHLGVLVETLRKTLST